MRAILSLIVAAVCIGCEPNNRTQYQADAQPRQRAGFQNTGANQVFVGYHAMKLTDGSSYQTAIGSNWSERPKQETGE